MIMMYVARMKKLSDSIDISVILRIQKGRTDHYSGRIDFDVLSGSSNLDHRSMRAPNHVLIVMLGHTLRNV